MNAVDAVRSLLDRNRLAVAGALAVRDGRADELGDRTGLRERDVLDALGALRSAGLVVATDDGYGLDTEAIRSIARAIATEELPMDPFIGYGMTDEERVVLSRFFRGRVLAEIPTNRSKRLIVLQRLALEFDVGTHYPEREVNQMLGAFHPDWSALRRYLVDEGFLDRADSVYWRSGGKVLLDVGQPGEA